MVHSGLFKTVNLVRWPYIGEFKVREYVDNVRVIM